MPSPPIVLLRTQSDARLVALARDGHERAFEAIVERYRRQLLRACRRVLPEGRAEDALQQALMAAWHGLQRGDEVRELRPWIHRIARNASLNLLRQSGYEYEELQESLRIADAPDEELERRAVVRQTLQGLAALPARQREALLAIAVEGRSQDEVAVDLGLSTGAVRQLVHRARCTLRAAATAVVPLPVVSWIASAGGRGELTPRIAELSAGAGGVGASAALAKAGTVAVLAGGAVLGPAIVEKRVHSDRAPATAEAAAAAPRGDREVRLPSRSVRAVRPVAAVASPAAHPRHAAARDHAASRRTAAVAPLRQATRRERDEDEVDESPRSGPSGGDRDDGVRLDDDHGSRGGPSGGDTLDRSGGGEPLAEHEDGSGPSLRSGSGSGSGSGGGDDLAERDLSAPAPSPTPAEEPESDSSGPDSGGEYERHGG